jgi:hypothetical protein
LFQVIGSGTRNSECPRKLFKNRMPLLFKWRSMYFNVNLDNSRDLEHSAMVVSQGR